MSMSEHNDPVLAPKPKLILNRLRWIFFNRFNHWRAGPRMALYFALAFLGISGLEAVLKLLITDFGEGPFTSITRQLPWLAGNIAMIAAALILLRWLDKRPTALLGLNFRTGWLRELGMGLALGIAMISSIVVVLLISGAATLSLAPDPISSLAILPAYISLFILAAAMEEVLYRGYLLQALAEGTRPWIAILCFGIYFGLKHADNPNATVLGVMNVILGGIFFAQLYFQTRRLWLPLGIHISWNLFQGWFWGFRVSGFQAEERLLIPTVNGHKLLTGGEFGLEGGLITTVLLAALVIWLFRKAVFHPTPAMAELWSPYPQGYGQEPV